MPLYRITAPNGQTYQIEGPPGASDAEVADAVMAQYPESGTPKKQSTIGSELVRGGKQLVSSARTGIGSIFDPEGAARAGVARSEDIGREAGEGVSLEAVKKAYKDKGLLSAAGEVVSQVPRALAGQGANLASMYAGAKAGSAAGSAFGVPGRAVGAALGTGAVLLPQFMGSNVERQAEEQIDAGKNVDIDRKKAYIAAAGQAALEGVGTAFTLGKRVVGGILGLTDDAALKTVAAQAELVKAAERSLAASTGRGVVRGAAEMPVEVAQQVLERYQAGLELTSPEAYKEYGESAYQAALIGGPLGGAAGAAERGQARGQLDQQRRAAEAAIPREPKEEVVPGAKLPEEAPAGKQGALFTPQEMGKKVAQPKQEAAPVAETFPELTARREQLRAQEQTPEVRAELDDIAKRLAPQSEGQLDLGLDFQREYTDLYKERDRLREGPQTPEVKARIAEVSGQLASYDEADIGQRQAEKIIKEQRLTEEAEKKAADDAAAQRFPGLAGPTTAPITQADVDAIGLPLKTSKQWITANVLGKTVEEIKALVQRDPKLISGTGARAGVLKALIAPQPAAFTEKQDEPTITKTDKPQGELDLGGGESGVGVSGEPAVTDVVQPGTGVPATTGTLETPDGLGLAPAGQPAGTGATSEGTQPTTVISDAPTTTPADTGAAATTTTTTGPKKTTKRTPKTTTTKETQAPATTGTAKTVNPFAALVKDTGDAETTVEEEAPKPAKTKSPFDISGPSTIGEKLQAETEDTKAGQAAARAARAAEEAEKAAAEAKKAAEKIKKADEDRKADEAKKAEEAKKAKEAAATAAASTAKQFYDRVAVEPTWSKQYGTALKPIVFENADHALYRALNQNGQPRYYVVNKQGRKAIYPVTVPNQQPSWLLPGDYAILRDAADALGLKELELARNNPDGPFSAGKNVVASDDAGANIEGYTRNLLQALGLGDLRIFIFAKPNADNIGYIDKYKLYGNFSAMAEPQRSELNGSAINLGIDGKTYGIYLNPTMSQGKTLEVLAHEIGHIVQRQLYDNASTAEQKAITDEYLAWRKKAKLTTKREFMQMLRNREDAEFNVAIAERRGDADTPANTLSEFDSYWISFGEWFADNVSRWATTNEKPLSIADKFFSKVAQMMRDLVAIVTSRKYPPAKSVADFLNKAGPANFKPVPNISLQESPQEIKQQFSVSFGTEQLIDSMGPLNRDETSGLKKLIAGVQSNPDVGYVTKFRTQVTDIAATIEKRLSDKFDGAVRNSLGELNPMGLYRQAQDYTKMLLEYFQTGTLYKDKTTGLWKSGVGEGVRPPAEVYGLIDKYAEKNGYSRERATQIASRVLEGVRLNEMRRSNKQDGTTFLIHLKDNEIDQLVKEFNADPDLQEMSKLMDEARKAMVDNLVAVGRLSAEEGKLWREVVGYVPFDRETIDSVAANFNKAKKISGKGLAQLGKLPELVGSLNRPVGNVFDN
jgi:hypothetical protein